MVALHPRLSDFIPGNNDIKLSLLFSKSVELSADCVLFAIESVLVETVPVQPKRKMADIIMRFFIVCMLSKLAANLFICIRANIYLGNRRMFIAYSNI